MASLHSLPEHLVGVLYSLLPDRDSRRAFLSCSASVRRAPSVLSQITKLSISAEQLANCHAINPLACLPAGVRLKQLEVQFGKEGTLTDLLQPQQQGARARVQEVLGQLQHLKLYHGGITPAGGFPLPEPVAVGMHLQHLPLRTLEIEDMRPRDVPPLLHAMSAGGSPAVQSLKTFLYLIEDMHAKDLIAIVSAVAAFKSLEDVALDCCSTHCPSEVLQPLTLLPLLRKLDIAGSFMNVWGVLLELTHLEILRVAALPSAESEDDGVLALRSPSLKHLCVAYMEDFAELEDALDLAPEGEGVLPRLRTIEVDICDDKSLRDAETGRQKGRSLMAKLDRFPQLEFRFAYITPSSFVAFVELTSLVPALGKGVQNLIITRHVSQLISLIALPTIFPNIQGLAFEQFSSAEVRALCEVVRELRSLCRLRFGNIRWMIPGAAASLLALCVQAACCDDREVPLSVELHSMSSDDEESHVEAEEDAFVESWEVAKAALESCRCPCKVVLDV